MPKFGFEQVLSMTPKIVKRVRDSFLFIIAGSLAFTPILAPKIHVAADDFGQWCGFALIVVKGFSMLFGVSDDEAKQVIQKEVEKLND